MTDQIAIWAFPLASFVWPGLGQLLQRRTSRGIGKRCVNRVFRLARNVASFFLSKGGVDGWGKGRSAAEPVNANETLACLIY